MILNFSRVEYWILDIRKLEVFENYIILYLLMFYENKIITFFYF